MRHEGEMIGDKKMRRDLKDWRQQEAQWEGIGDMEENIKQTGGEGIGDMRHEGEMIRDVDEEGLGP